VAARKLHLDVSVGLRRITACGHSLHGWSVQRYVATTDFDRVTCATCVKMALAASGTENGDPR